MTDVMKQHGAFSWNELMTTDVNAAKTFYGELFGWTHEDMPVNDMIYTMAKAADTEVAGIMAMPAEAGNTPPTWGAYVTVDDVEASAKQAEAFARIFHRNAEFWRNISESGRYDAPAKSTLPPSVAVVCTIRRKA